jgi:hypothetical protein
MIELIAVAALAFVGYKAYKKSSTTPANAPSTTPIKSNGSTKVYIEMTEITTQNLAQLRALGVAIQIIGEPNPDRAAGEVYTTVPTVQALVPVRVMGQVSALPFVRSVGPPVYGFTS